MFFCYYIFDYFNCIVSAFNSYAKTPSVILFLLISLILTFKTGFLQFRGFKRFIELVFYSLRRQKDNKNNIKAKIMSPFHALFTAMATTIGIGNIIGPSLAIKAGGPGALFWLIVYIFFSSATKFVEVTFAVYSRKISKEGNVIGGPSQYLGMVSPFLAKLYALLTMFLFTVWSGVQVNTISSIGICENIPVWVTGLISVLILLFVVLSGVKKMGSILSKLVPFMFLFYISFALYIIFKDCSKLSESIKLVFNCIFSYKAFCGGTLGITFFTALKEGVYKSIFITESGLGTSSIAHSLSDVKEPIDQGILAMFSGIADIILCTLSGLLALVTGLWNNTILANTIIYQAFKLHCPIYGAQVFLLLSVFLFAITSLIGNTFNASQSFASLFGYKYIKLYFIVAALVAFLGAVIPTPFLWNMTDLITTFVAFLNLFGLLILSYKYYSVIKFK